MHWNYRVIKSVPNEQDIIQGFDEVTYAVHEVFYDDDNEIQGWSEDPASPFGTEVSEIIGDVFYILDAFDKPICLLQEGDLTETDQYINIEIVKMDS
jgi:hypothetical protein